VKRTRVQEDISIAVWQI